jgi:hypothetical protein
MSNRRMKHRGTPSVNSISNKGNDTQRMIGKHVLHPTKGWRKITPINILEFRNNIQEFINQAIRKSN